MGTPATEPKRKKKRTTYLYHDGENVTHYLGNDDYSQTDLPDLNDIEDNPKLLGKVAEGNELINDDVEETASEAEKVRTDQQDDEGFDSHPE